jgi:cytoskeletal protein RodZ
MGVKMSKRLLLLLGAVCIILIVAGFVNFNWSPDVTATTPNNSTEGDNPESTEDNNTSTNSTTNGNTETSTPDNSTETTTEDNITTNSTTNGDAEPSTTDNNTTGDNTHPTTNPPSEPDNPPDDTNGDSSNTTKPETPQPNQDDHEEEGDYTWDSSEVTAITLNTDAISVDDESGTTIIGTKIVITAAGTYSISGTLEDGQIVVNTNDVETVKLILDGVNISSSTNAPVYVEDAEKTVIVLADNSENYLADNANNVDNGTLSSRDALTIYGNGALTVYGNDNDAIRSNDGLIIKSGNITVTSVDDGVRGKDYLVIKGGNVTVNSVGDGLKSDNDEEADRGYISIEGGTIKVTSSQGDAISAQTDLLVTGGTFTLTSGGGSSAHPDENLSTKGLKAGVFMIIDDGNFTVNSSDDAIHSNHKIIINNGTYHLASGDDGIHADTSVEINNGTVDISKSYEGIESESITVNDGYIEIAASDDAFNAVETADSSAGGFWGGGDFGPPGDYYVYINGGFIYVDANGDGLDTNGHIAMTGGFVIVNGPSDNMNAAIDYAQGTFNLTGGTLVAAGSSMMAQGPSNSSTQYSVLVNFRSPQTANKLVNIQTASGETVLTFRPTKVYQSIVFSSDELSTGEYKVFLGGTTTGTSNHGFYEDGTYTPGSEYTNFTITSIATAIGGGGMFWGPP